MTSLDKKRSLGKVLRWLIPLAFSGLAFWLILRTIDFEVFLQNLAEIGWKTILLASMVYFAGFFFRVFCWFILLRRKVSYKNGFFTLAAGSLLNNIFPFRLGEVGRAMLLDDPEGTSALEVFSSVVVERIFDVFLAAIFILLMLPRVLGGVFDQRLIYAAFIVALTGLVVLYLIASNQQRVTALLHRWGERWAFIKTWVTPKAAQLLEGLSVLNNPRAFLVAFGSLTISWLLAFLENHIVFRSLYPDSPFWWMIFVLSAASFGGALPSAPASLGVFEGVMVAAFSLLGVPPETAFTHAIVIHAIAFVYSNILGLIGLRMRGQAVVALYQRAVHRPPHPQSSE